MKPLSVYCNYYSISGDPRYDFKKFYLFHRPLSWTILCQRYRVFDEKYLKQNDFFIVYGVSNTTGVSINFYICINSLRMFVLCISRVPLNVLLILSDKIMFLWTQTRVSFFKCRSKILIK